MGGGGDNLKIALGLIASLYLLFALHALYKYRTDCLKTKYA
ncbi:hypothetical protein [Helicobacter sp. 12S02634-8]|nr:hypothetical protein [Helicobacter sp. 12S02634-8]